MNSANMMGLGPRRERGAVEGAAPLWIWDDPLDRARITVLTLQPSSTAYGSGLPWPRRFATRQWRQCRSVEHVYSVFFRPNNLNGSARPEGNRHQN